MTSTENLEQNEYEDSFKRFKTLFIVGAACFCLGVTVVILGNRFQLYEVQRLGIIFSSFGIGWIVLAISYLVYMKWCFVPGETENRPQQVIERNVTRERSVIPRTLGKPHSLSKVFETLPQTEEKTLGRHSSLVGRTYGRSTSLVANLQRTSPSINSFEKRPVHSSRKFEKRSYSVRNFRDRPYAKDCKRLTASFKNCESPLSSNFEKRMLMVGSYSTALQRNFLCDKVPIQPGKPENAQSAIKASSDRYFAGTSFPGKSLSRNFERPLSELKDSERPSAFENKSVPQPTLIHRSEEQVILRNQIERPSLDVEPFEGLPNSNFETKTAPVKNCEISPNPSEDSFEMQMSLARDLERRRTLENCERRSVSIKHSCTCPARMYEDSLPLEKDTDRSPSVQHKSDASQSCKIDLDTKQQKSTPPDYYAVVLSMRESDK